MSWKISRISIPVFDIKESSLFYNFLLNSENKKPQVKFGKDECFVLRGDCELKLYKIKNHFEYQSRRTFPSIKIKNLKKIVNKFKENKIKYIQCNYTNDPLINSILVQETSFNVIELIDFDHFQSDVKKINKTDWQFHHINLESYNVRKSVNFLKKFLLFKEGIWNPPEKLGDVNINNKQLAIFPLNFQNGGVHINKADFTFSTRNNFDHNPTIGGHPAFSVKNINQFIKKLKRFNITFTDAKIYAMPKIHQVYLHDPNANVIEINQRVD